MAWQIRAVWWHWNSLSCLFSWFFFFFYLQEEVESPDIHFTPIISLPPVQLATLEEDEDVMFKMLVLELPVCYIFIGFIELFSSLPRRAKLYRYDSNEDPPEWKERGVGDVKLLKHKEHGTCRLLMRRDKTLKVCANHAVLPLMELKPNCGSDKAWVWSTPADFADEEAKAELLAIRFKTAEGELEAVDSLACFCSSCDETPTGGLSSSWEERLNVVLMCHFCMISMISRGWQCVWIGFFLLSADAQKFKETFDEAKKIMEVKIAEKEAGE